MITPHKNYIVSEIKEGDYILQINNNSYLVGDFIFQILKKNVESSTEEEVYSYLIEQYEGLDKKEIDKIIEENVNPLFQKSERDINNNPVKSVAKVFNPEKFKGLLKILSVFFSKNFFWRSFILLCVINIIFLSHFYHVSTINTNNLHNWIYVFSFTIIVVFIHEFGHVASAYRYGVLTKEVGFGFYFVYPAFYTNLTEVWRLDKYKRTIINLAGVYFQLLVGLLLIIVSYSSKSHSELLYHMFYSNLLIVFFNINPLFKFDGYWIFSDWFEFYNLRDSSQKVLLNFVGKSKFPDVKKNKKVLLIIYSVTYFLFMLFIWFALFRYVVVSSNELYEMILIKKQYTFDMGFFKKIIWFLVTLYLSLRIIITNSKSIKKLI